MRSRLLPCPFCAAKAKLGPAQNGQGFPIPTCTSCGSFACLAEGGSQAAHIRRWNTRPLSAASENRT